MNRDYALDYLKFFATFLIINSHLGKCYGEYSALATGGAIGNGLFFFVSGFALSLGRVDRFDNWLKRRFFRLYPSVISKDILAGMVLGVTLNPVRQLVTGGGVVSKGHFDFLSGELSAALSQ